MSLWSPDTPISPRKFPFFYGWIIVAVSTLGIVFSIPGQTMGFSVFTDILIRELKLTRVELSTAYCVGTVFSGFTLPWLGRIFDRFGARKLIVGSSLATGLVLFFLSAAHTLSNSLAGVFPFLTSSASAFLVITIGFYLIRVSAQGVLTMTSKNAMGKWFDYNRGTALAISGMVTSFSFSIAPKVLNELIEKLEWWGTWIALGIASIFGMAFIGWIFLRDNPEECGLKMDGNLDETKKRQAHADSITHRDYTGKEAISTVAFWMFNLSFSFFSLFSTAVTFHIVSLGEAFGRPKEDILNYFIPMALLSVFTNLFFGWISSRTKLKYLLTIMNLAALTGVIGTLYLATPIGLVAYIAGNGMCGGAFAALSGIVWPRFFGRKHLGAVSGIGMSSMVIASGIGPLLFSVSLAITGNYILILWLSALIPTVLVFGSLTADNPQRQAEEI